MKYFIDTEFLEGKQKEKFPISLFRKETPNTIDLISVGIVAEDGREYYAISKDFNLREAWNRFDWKHDLGGEPKKVYWIRENVLKLIFEELLSKFNKESDTSLEMDSLIPNSYIGCIPNQTFRYSLLKFLINYYGKTNKEIAEEVKKFVYTTSQINDPEAIDNWNEVKHLFPVEFYAYFADYDWVVFCWLFGKMMDLPKGFPMYCKDLKQMMDDKRIPDDKGRLVGLQAMKSNPNYPKQTDCHNALADAKWNKKLYEFLNSL